MSHAVREMLRARYPKDRYALFEEVRNGGGMMASRSCDMMAMALWPSDGYALHGIEIKVSRSDWLRELKQPEKADEFMAVCDYWWLAIGDREIVKEGELSAGWGLLAPRGDRLVMAKQAHKLTPIPIDRGTLSSLLRRAMETSASTEQIEAARKQGYTDAKIELDQSSRSNASRLRSLEEVVREFEEASGLKLPSYGAGFYGARRIGEAVKLILSNQDQFGGHAAQLSRVADALERAAKQSRAVATELQAVEQPTQVSQ